MGGGPAFGGPHRLVYIYIYIYALYIWHILLLLELSTYINRLLVTLSYTACYQYVAGLQNEIVLLHVINTNDRIRVLVGKHEDQRSYAAPEQHHS